MSINRPDRLKIGAITYSVNENDDLHKVDTEGKKRWLHGHILFADAEIKIAGDQSPDVKVVTLWHEAMHGILNNAGQSEQPEALLEALSFGIVELIRSNPQLVSYTLSPKDAS